MKNSDRKETMEKIAKFTKELRLPATRRNIAEEIIEAEKSNLNYEDFLCGLLSKESDLRIENGKKNRIRAANFPYKKYIEDLSVDDLPHDAKKKLKVLTSLDFIKNGQNIILAGSPGTGNYRKFLLMERNKHISLFLAKYIFISFHNTSK